jgi:hypothetical protein
MKYLKSTNQEHRKHRRTQNPQKEYLATNPHIRPSNMEFTWNFSVSSVQFLCILCSSFSLSANTYHGLYYFK